MRKTSATSGLSRSRPGLLIVLSLCGLYVIEYLYAWLTPFHLQIGSLLTQSFMPLTYPPIYWMVRLVETLLILGPIGWLCGARRWRLLLYLIAGYLLALHGPLLVVLAQLYLPRE